MGVWMERTHAHAGSRHGDLEVLILFLCCCGVAGAEGEDEFGELGGAGFYS